MNVSKKNNSVKNELCIYVNRNIFMQFVFQSPGHCHFSVTKLLHVNSATDLL